MLLCQIAASRMSHKILLMIKLERQNISVHREVILLIHWKCHILTPNHCSYLTQ